MIEMKRYSSFIFVIYFPIILFVNNSVAQNRFTISGTVTEKGSRELMVGANIFIPEKNIGTTTNSYGFYSLTIPADSVELMFSYVGYTTRNFKINLDKNIILDVELEASLEIEAVEIKANLSKSSSRSPQMSVMEIPVKQVKSIPAFLGEKDVLKVIQLMPGVQKGNEGSSGFYVRGGGPDQNLIIIDDAPVYNAYHLFGFVSLFNGDALKSIELTKGGFPARYGGRLSSVLDIIMKDGNKEDLTGEAGIGLISSRLVLEGPIKKENSSFIFSGRRTYIDMLIYPFEPSDIKGGYFFYDFTAKANFELNSKNRIFISGYFGRDKLYGREKSGGDRYESGLFWDNATTTVRLNSILGEKTFSNTSLIFSNYRLKIYDEEKYNHDRFELSYRSGIRDIGLKYDMSWMPEPIQTFRFGVSTVWHDFTPSAIVLKDDYIGNYSRNVKSINTLESGVYLEDEVKFFNKGIINAGFRVSHYLHDRSSEIHFEPRISGSVFLGKELSMKASFAQMNQFIHLLSNTGLGLPTDLWVPATKGVPSQGSWQAALGFTKDIPKYSATLSLEGYYKESKNVIGYKEGATFLMIDDPTSANEVNWEENVTSGFGWSYGLELLAQRKTGKLSGWVGYTLSWTKLKFDEINFGKSYFARYDRRHDISVVGIYEIHDGLTFSATWVFGTGNAITLPIATYPGYEHQPTLSHIYNEWFQTIEDYGGKNSFRMAPYHRLDIGFQFHKKKLKYERTWEFSVYNVYNRHNPYFYYIDQNDKGENILKQVSLFPILPSISWAIKF